MKFYIRFLVLLSIVFIVLACSNNNNSNDESKNIELDQRNVQDDKYFDPDAIEKYDFRKAKWGMSMQEVRESEDTEPKLESENTLDYTAFLMGMQAQIGYTFYNDELIRAGFFFVTKLKSGDAYIDKYTQIKEELIKVNGKPVIDTVQTIDPAKTFSEEEKGEAICNGDLLYATQWDLPNTDIQLVLRGDKSECKLTILYLSEEGVRQLMKKRLNQEQ